MMKVTQVNDTEKSKPQMKGPIVIVSDGEHTIIRIGDYYSYRVETFSFACDFQSVDIRYSGEMKKMDDQSTDFWFRAMDLLNEKKEKAQKLHRRTRKALLSKLRLAKTPRK